MENAPERKPLPSVVEDGYQAWMWVEDRIASFPVDARRRLGHRIADAALDGLVATTDAAYAPRGAARVERLRDGNRALTRLRILLRGARERRYVSIAQHEHAMRLIDNWGRQLGGWLAAERAR